MSLVSSLVEKKVGNIRAAARAENRSLSEREKSALNGYKIACSHLENKIFDGKPFTDEERQWLDKLDADVNGGKPVEQKGFHSAVGQIRDNISSIRSRLDSSLHNIRNEARSARGVISRRLGQQPFCSLGDFLINVKNAASPGENEQKTIALSRLSSVQAAASGANETTPSEGGFLVPTQFVQEILMDSYGEGQLAKRCRKQPISIGNGCQICGVDESSRETGSRFGGVQSFWVSEASEIEESQPKFREINLECRYNATLIRVTNSLLKDATSLDGFIREVAPREIAYAIDNAIIRGTGAGMPLGILNAGCTIEVAAEESQAAGSIVSENIFKMISRTLGPLSNYVWLYNKSCLKSIFGLYLAVGTGGGPLFSSIEGKLLNIPLVEVEQCSTVGTSGDLILADMRSYIIADKELRSDISMHVRFLYDESIFRFIYSVDGQPVRSTPMTPSNGEDTQSHFVTLATRA